MISYVSRKENQKTTNRVSRGLRGKTQSLSPKDSKRLPRRLVQIQPTRQGVYHKPNRACRSVIFEQKQNYFCNLNPGLCTLDQRFVKGKRMEALSGMQRRVPGECQKKIKNKKRAKFQEGKASLYVLVPPTAPPATVFHEAPNIRSWDFLIVYLGDLNS